MPHPRKKPSRILEACLEGMHDLYQGGIIDKRRLEEFKARHLPVPDYPPEKIQALRERFHLSQAALASFLNTSLSTVRQWEIGHRHPGGPSLKLLHLLDRKGLDALI